MFDKLRLMDLFENWEGLESRTIEVHSLHTSKKFMRKNLYVYS